MTGFAPPADPLDRRRRPAGRLLIFALDLTAAAAVTLATGVGLAVRRRRPASSRPRRRVLLVFSTAYSLHVLRSRRAEHSVTHRDLDGYFDHVWTVHPLVGASPDEPPRSSPGAVSVTRLGDRHTVVEGTVALTPRLGALPLLNFALAQAQLVRFLSRLARTEEVSIVRAGEPYYTGLMALLLGRLHGIPAEIRIVANHDAIYEAVGTLVYPRLLRWRWLERALGRFTLARAEQVTVGSADNRAYALRNGAREASLAYVGNWAMIHPVHRLDPGARPPIPDEFGLDGRPLAISVSRLEPMKHPEDVLECLAKARATCPALAGLLIGDGVMRAELEALAAELGLDGHLFFPGDRDQVWVAAALASATVVLAPLAGLALVEAALSATPIVAYDYEWHAEVIETDRTGILVPYRDTDAMAAATCALVADAQRARRLGSAARIRALERTDTARALADERAQAERLMDDVSASRGRR